MVLPVLQPVPHLERLLAPDEVIIYTPKLHPLYGWPWLLGGLAVAIVGWWFKPLGLVAAGLWVVYWSPHNNFEAAVTTRRLLLRQGRMAVETEGILGNNIIEWHVTQTFWQQLLRAGSLRLVLKDREAHRPLVLPWVFHPFTIVEALETLQLKPREDDQGPSNV